MHRRSLLAALGWTIGLLALLALNPGGARAALADFHFLGVVTGLAGLDGAYGVALSPDGAHVYVTGNTDGTLVVMSRNANTGQLTHVQTLQDGTAGVEGLASASGLAVSPDGAHVYVAGKGDNALAVFSRDANTGQLTFVEALQDGVAGVDGLEGVVAVALSPDGAHVYAAGHDEDALAVFSRDADTGQLTFVEALQDGQMQGVSTVDGLDGIFDLTLSPDGEHLYTAGLVDNAVATFNRDTSTGQLTFVEALQDGQKQGNNTIDGLAGATGVVVSPDGRYVYVTGLNDNSVVRFFRGSVTGKLIFLDMARNGIDGVQGLLAPWSLAVTPDGEHLVVAAFGSNALTVFQRNGLSGQITFQETLVDGTNGVDGLNQITGVAASPDSTYVYTASGGDSAVAIFATVAVQRQIFLPLIQR